MKQYHIDQHLVYDAENEKILSTDDVNRLLNECDIALQATLNQINDATSMELKRHLTRYYSAIMDEQERLQSVPE